MQTLYLLLLLLIIERMLLLGLLLLLFFLFLPRPSVSSNIAGSPERRETHNALLLSDSTLDHHITTHLEYR